MDKLEAANGVAVNVGHEVAKTVPVSVGTEAAQAGLDKQHVAENKAEKLQTKATAAAAVNYFRLYRTATWPDVALMALGTLGAVANGAALPLFSLVLGTTINTFGGAPSSINSFVDELRIVVLYFVYIAAGTLVASYAEVTFWMLAGTNQANRMRQQYLDRVLRADVAYFDQHATTGELLQGLNEDCTAIQDAIAEKVGNFTHHFATFVTGFAIAFWKGWDMTLVMLACVPLLAGIGIAFTIMFTKTQARGEQAYGAAAGLVQEALSSVRTVYAFCAQGRMQARYTQALAYPEKVGIQAGAVNGIVLGTANGMFMFMYALALWYGSTRIIDGAYDGGKVLVVLFSAILGGMALGQAAPNVKYFQQGRIAGARVFALISRQGNLDEDAPGEELAAVTGAVELSGVRFAYPSRPEVEVLHSLSVKVPAGRTVAFVGESGSGKSTIVQLLCRFYDPLSGQVTLDGVDIRRLQLRWYRHHLGLVSQEPTLFATSIAANIAYGRPDASEQDIEAAARAANAHTFISKLPLRYQTAVGEHGIQLSGGQKQRIAIARAIVRNPRVLLLDEATSALDTRSERIVQAALDNLMKERTTVVVAHRLSTIVGADSIAVLQKGSIAELGSHSELIERPNGAYATLLKLQMRAAAQQGISETAGPSRVPEADEDALPAQSGDAAAQLAPSSFRSARAVSFKVGKIAADEEQGAAAGEAEALPWWQFWRRRSSKKHPEQPPVNASSRRLLAYNKPEWMYAVAGCLSSAEALIALVDAGAGVVMPISALALSSILAVFYEPSRIKHDVRKWCLVFVALGIAALGSVIMQQYSFGLMGQRLTRRLRQLLFATILRQEVSFFDLDENSSGALSSRLSTDTASIRGAVGDQLGILAQSLVTFAVAYIIAFINSWQLTLVITAVLPLLVMSTLIQGKFMVGFSSKGSKMFDQANQTATEAFASIRTVAAFSMARPLSDLYRNLLAAPTRVSAKRAHVNGIGFGYSQFIIFGVYALGFWYGGRLVEQGKLDLGELLKVFFAIIFAAFSMGQSQMAFPDITKAKAATQRVFAIIDRKPAIDSSDPSGDKPASLKGNLELRDLSFAYPQRREVPVFTQLNLQVQAGTTVALVGPSGGGKSTIVSLVQRFYDPTAGQILLDGRDIRHLNLHWLRSHMGLVSQEPVLFAGTIAQNIAFGCDDAPGQEAIEAAARTANAHGFIAASPGGYSTQLGDAGGISLSGGQKQRVAIARAVLRNPALLLLDEATSALDAASEGLVQSALERLMAGRTTLVIAHRLSTIRNAHSIAVVQDGTILERGTHDELMSKSKGAYASLIKHQHG